MVQQAAWPSGGSVEHDARLITAGTDAREARVTIVAFAYRLAAGQALCALNVGPRVVRGRQVLAAHDSNALVVAQRWIERQVKLLALLLLAHLLPRMHRCRQQPHQRQRTHHTNTPTAHAGPSVRPSVAALQDTQPLRPPSDLRQHLLYHTVQLTAQPRPSAASREAPSIVVTAA